jgi:phosphate:Na+ symporter
MDFGVFEFLKLVGALGFFIYGMKVMSEGIQKLAGSKLRSILNTMTGNRFSGVATGFATTSLVQSSSATTVMVVSFVNAGLLTLKQAIGVIMGANIGTTMTAILVTILGFSKFSLANYALPIIAIGFPLMFFRNNKAKSWSEFLIGFAFLFMGISFLKDAVPEFDANALEFLKSINSFGFLSTLIFVGIGTILTVILQSSSAAMTLTLVLCQKGIIDFNMAAAIVLGENIGTTITANLAALIANVHAKRAARAHLVFNLFGVAWMLLIFGSFLTLIDTYLVAPTYGSAYENTSSVKWGLTYFHIVFNILNTFILIWFVGNIEKIVIKITPSKNEEDKVYSLDYISGGLMSTPELSIVEASKEVANLGRTSSKMNTLVKKLLFSNNSKEQNKLIKELRHYEELTDRAEEEISKYLTGVSSQEVSDRTAKRISALLSIISDLETVGDIYYAISTVFVRKINDKVYLLPDQRNQLHEMVLLLDTAFTIMVDNLDLNNNKNDYTSAIDIELQINKMRNKLKKMHLKGIENGELNIQSASIFSEIYTNLERAGDHIYEVHQALEEAHPDFVKVTTPSLV